MAVELGILGSEFFVYIVLPFLLVFSLVFAILQKYEFLASKDRPDLNAFISLVFGLVVIGVPSATGVMIRLIPIISVILVILLSWMLMLAFIGGLRKGALSKELQRLFGIMLFIALIIAILWATGVLETAFKQPWVKEAGGYVVLFGAIIAVIAIVTSGWGPKPKEEEE